MIWSGHWQQAAERMALGYLEHPDGDPIELLGVDALLGEGQYATTTAQVQLPIAALNNSKEAAF